jgi:hypothetical protein
VWTCACALKASPRHRRAAGEEYSTTWEAQQCVLGDAKANGPEGWGRLVVDLIFSRVFTPAIMGLIKGIGFMSMTDEAFDVKYNAQRPSNEPWDTMKIAGRLRKILFGFPFASRGDVND